MKLTIYLLVTLLVIFTTIPNVYAHYTDGHNGRPNCLTEHELIQRNWRNNFDPTRYWICSVLRVPGDELLCESGKLFVSNKNECVPEAEWLWTPPVDPPSLA